MSKPNPEERNRMVTDAMKHLGDINGYGKIKDLSIEHQIINKAKGVTFSVQEQVKPIVNALLKANQPIEEVALSATVGKFYFDRFAGWTKDELLYLVSLIHTENAVGKIKDEIANL